MTSGYTPCACRDCFDIAISDDWTVPDLCWACEEAGCDSDGECVRTDFEDEECEDLVVPPAPTGAFAPVDVDQILGAFAVRADLRESVDQLVALGDLTSAAVAVGRLGRRALGEVADPDGALARACRGEETPIERARAWASGLSIGARSALVEAAMEGFGELHDAVDAFVAMVPERPAAAADAKAVLARRRDDLESLLWVVGFDSDLALAADDLDRYAVAAMRRRIGAAPSAWHEPGAWW